MPMIFISESGDDKNSGLSPRRPIHSLHRRLELKTGEDELVIVGKTMRLQSQGSHQKLKP